MWTGVAGDTFRVADDRAEDLYDERLGRGVEGKSTGNHSATCAGVFRQKRVRVAWSIRALGLVQQARSRVGGWSGAGQSAVGAATARWILPGAGGAAGMDG